MVAVHRRHKERDGGCADQAWKGLEGVANDMRRSMVSLLASLRLVQRREAWCPTFLGWLCLTLLFAIPVAWWCSNGELFLSSTRRLPADVLVVEGWIGREGAHAAGAV